ncbi:tRNA lysidine(34) synthetase TilS [bacterium]|nr:MAG: tRNA lysidine(34) synthetase TilS [bacterium]
MATMFIEKIKQTIKKFNLISKGDKILIAVSGGPDSLALLRVFFELHKALKLDLCVAHLDHMLREGSNKDRLFVENLAKKLGMNILSGQVDLKKCGQKGSLEEIARNIRMDFLFKIAQDTQCDAIALGHNLDDQAETVLMRLLRGAGLYGLCGIMPARTIRGHRIIRPLLEVSRKEIIGFLKKRKLVPLFDKTNLDDVYFRNKIRNRLIPLLEKEYNPNIKNVLANMAQVVSWEYDYLINVAQLKSQGLGKSMAIDKLLRLHPAIRRLIFRLAIRGLQGNMRRITFQHISEIEDLLLNRPLNSIVDLPKCISVAKKKKTLLFYRRNK